jgi:hypothetical protein
MEEDAGIGQARKFYDNIDTSVSMESDIVRGQVKRKYLPGTSSYVGNTQVIVCNGNAGMNIVIERVFPQIMLQV